MSKIKEHFHEEIAYGQRNDDHVSALLSRDTIINLKVLLDLTILNEKDGFSHFYLTPSIRKQLKNLKDELDRL
tara:strand:- start:3574 stop:3792 length:219 start_codon:yes stop_codon:yes gene_type:complete